MSFSDDDKERFEQELEDTDVKAILLGIHAELVELRQTVDGSERNPEFACKDCGESFAELGALEQHSVEAHKAPPNMEPDAYQSV